jgi:hypothetical protein
MDVVKAQPWWFRVEQDQGYLRRPGVQPWWIAGKVRGPHRGSLRESQKSGYAMFTLPNPRNQRVATKPSISTQRGGGAWEKHGWYLQRQGAQQAERTGIGFDAEGNAVHIPRTLAAWQRAGDPHLFKIMLGPEHATMVDLQAFARTVMREMEQDLGRPLQWVAIDHHNTDPHRHVHVCLRGRDREGHELQIAKDYLMGSLAWRAGEVLTRTLGWKLAPELEQLARQAVRERRYGQHDRSLERKLDHNREVRREHLTRWETQRLAVLEKRGLAWTTDTGWQLAYQWEERLKMEQERERQPAMRQDRQQSERRGDRQQDRKEQEREREEAEERQRRIRTIDQLEQEWSR